MYCAEVDWLTELRLLACDNFNELQKIQIELKLQGHMKHIYRYSPIKFHEFMTPFGWSYEAYNWDVQQGIR